MNYVYDNDGEKSHGFTSSAKQEGNIITIDVEEYYAKNTFEVSEYETFKTVINAAADFNKTSIIVKKK